MSMAKVEERVEDNRLRELERRVKTLEDWQWLALQEFRAYASVNNHQPIERMIESVAPRNLWNEHMARYRFVAPHVCGKKVLDMACGTGYGTHLLSAQGEAEHALGVDVSSDALRYASLNYKQPNLSFSQEDACTRWTNERFDVVTSFETIEHVPHPDGMLQSISEMLQPNGLFFVSTPVRLGGTLKDQPYNQHHLREWTINEFREMLTLYFQSVELWGQRWEPAARFAGIRVPTRICRTLLRLQGIDQERLNRLAYEILPLNSGAKFGLPDTPMFVVAACSTPNPPPDPVSVRKQCYGE